MESISEIIDTQTFSRQLVDVDETNDLINSSNVSVSTSEVYLKRSESPISVNGGVDSIIGHGLSSAVVNVRNTVHEVIVDDRLVASREGRLVVDEEPNSVVMVIDDLGQSSVQTTYQIIPQHLQDSPLPLPLSLHGHDQDHGLQQQRSPEDFVGSDITLDALSVGSASSSTVPQLVTVKQEHKLVIVHQNADPSRHNTHTHSLVMDELSSDGVEVTLNEHHQRLLEQQHQYNHRHHMQAEMLHHQQHREQQQHQQNSQHMPSSLSRRVAQLGQIHAGDHHDNSHNETLSVIVQSQEDCEDEEEDEDDDDRESSNHLLSPALGVGDNSLEHGTYQTLTSRLSPPDFSPTSYATLTPIQPLPPISTMSDKFAYTSSSGNVNGGSGSGSNGGANSNDCGPFTGLPMPVHHQGSMGGLSLNGLGSVQSPYSSYDKLPSMISPPAHSFASSPSHTLSGMVVSCELHGSSVSVPSPGGCGTLSPQPELHSPQVNGTRKSDGQRQCHSHGPSLQTGVVTMNDGIVVSDYESAFNGSHQREPDREQEQEHELIIGTSSSSSTGGRNSQLRLQHSPLSSHSVSAGSVVSMSLHSPGGCNSSVSLSHINGAAARNLSTMHGDGVIVSLTPSPPPPSSSGDVTASVRLGDMIVGNNNEQQQQQILHSHKNHSQINSECNPNGGLHLTNVDTSSHNVCNVNELNRQQQAEYLCGQQKQNSPKTTNSVTVTPPPISLVQTTSTATITRSLGGGNSGGSGVVSDMEEINTKELAQRISAELKRYSIPQAIFAQRVLCRSQGTLSDLLRNPKPWSKLKSGRETFRRMFKWLQEPEFQRMSALRMAAAQIPQRNTSALTTTTSSPSPITATIATSSLGNGGNISSANIPGGSHTPNISGNNVLSGSSPTISNCRRKEEPHIEQMPQPKKPRLVFTDLQRRTLQAIFKETKRPSKEMQVTIARQLGLEPTTVGNFFMNARRRSMDKWRDDDVKSSQHRQQQHHQQEQSNNSSQGHYSNSGSSNLHTTALSPLGNHQSLDFDEDQDQDIDNDFDDLVDEHDHDM